MDKEITIYDIAKILGKSPATISRALNDHPAINIKTKSLIVGTAHELGYRSNTFASNLRRKNTNTLGVIVPRLNSTFMSSVLAGMESVANLAGYNLLISQSLESAGKEKANAVTMYNSRVDGLLVSLAYDTEDFSHFENFIKKKIPVLFFDRVMEHEKCTRVVIDNISAGYDATSHLISQGCERIMHVTGNLKRNVYAGRFDGYRNALINHGLNYDDSLLMVTDLSQEAGVAAAEKLRSMKARPDGIFISSDLCAVSCIKALKYNGFNIPQDIAVVGFNNDPVSEVIEPNLTTVYYPGRQMGEIAVKTMIMQLKGLDNIPPSNTITLTSELLMRASSTKRDG
jgi:LacI family transcriptional regulator